MLPEKELRQADLIGSALLAGLGIAVIVGALGMPLSGSHGGSEVRWYTSPAALPLVLGVLLVSLSGGVFVRAVRRGGHRPLKESTLRALRGLPRNATARRVAIIWLLIAGYVLLLMLHPFAGLSRIFDRIIFLHGSFAADPEVANYIPCSILFLAVFMILFYYRHAPGAHTRRTLIVAALSIGVPWLVAFAFKVHLYAPLPW